MPGRVVARAGAAGHRRASCCSSTSASGSTYRIAIGLLLVGGWLVMRRRAAGSCGYPTRGLGRRPSLFAGVRGRPRRSGHRRSLDVHDRTRRWPAGALASFGGLRGHDPPVRRVWSALGVAGVGWAPGRRGARYCRRADVRAIDGRLSATAGRQLPVVRGLAIAIPVMLVFIALFSSADAVFASIIDDLFDFDLELGRPAGRVLLALVLGLARGRRPGLRRPPSTRGCHSRHARRQPTAGGSARPRPSRSCIAVDRLFVRLRGRSRARTCSAASTPSRATGISVRRVRAARLLRAGGRRLPGRRPGDRRRARSRATERASS